jgi:acyl-CoA synthetase (AMP-forming)/AMP-acid ligase II
VTGGENVWPEAVEAVIAAHRGVAEVAVNGVNDPEWGQRVVAWVVPRGEPPTLPQLRALVAEMLPAFCAPKELHLVSELPKTALGKVQRHRLVVPPTT